MIAMSSGTSELFLQVYMCYCSLIRMPERHMHQPKQPYMDALSYKLLKDLNRLQTVCYLGLVGLVQLVRQWTVVLMVSGPIPNGGMIFFLAYPDMSPL